MNIILASVYLLKVMSFTAIMLSIDLENSSILEERQQNHKSFFVCL